MDRPRGPATAVQGRFKPLVTAKGGIPDTCHPLRPERRKQEVQAEEAVRGQLPQQRQQLHQGSSR